MYFRGLDLGVTQLGTLSRQMSPTIRYKTTKQALEIADQRTVEGPFIVPEKMAELDSKLVIPAEIITQPR